MNAIDIITFVRIVGSICILFTGPFTTMFFTFYSFCGICDAADGIISRKIEEDSIRSAKLDNFADIVFAAVIVVKILPALNIPVLIISWIMVIAVIRFLGNFIGYRKFRTYSRLHTYANKLTGFLIFIFPFFYQGGNVYIMGIVICSIASVSSIEELMIIIKAKKYNRDCRSIFDKDRF